jgi:hypothetical protein
MLARLHTCIQSEYLSLPSKQCANRSSNERGKYYNMQIICKIYFKSISYLRLCLQILLLPSDFGTGILYSFHVFPM